MIGMDANRDVIPMGFVFILVNESDVNWKRAWVFFHNKHPAVGRLTTIFSDGDKGITKDWSLRFQQDTGLILCSQLVLTIVAEI